MGFLGGLVVKNPPANTGDADLIPGSGRCPGGGSGNSVQYSWPENSMDRGAWQAAFHGFAESDTTDQQLSTTMISRVINLCFLYLQ